MPEQKKGHVGLELSQHIGRITMDRIGEQWLENVRRNQQVLNRGKSIRELAADLASDSDHAVVIAAGPSIKRKAHVAPLLKKHDYRGMIISTDSSIYYCLRNGIIPDLVVTLDPHTTRVVRWFGDPELNEEKLKKDDYFVRQEMDTDFSNQIRTNRELLGLLNEHGHKMKIAMATSASKAVVDRVLETGISVYWWNPMYDDPDEPKSVTREIYGLNQLPCINGGGNVGAACWMIADAVLRKKHVAVVGMDFSYYKDTSYLNTQYYTAAVDLVGKENLDSIYIRVFNPHYQEWFYTDPTYWWYRERFLEILREADCTTYNCTEGGILFGDPVRVMPFESFLTQRAGAKVLSQVGSP